MKTKDYILKQLDIKNLNWKYRTEDIEGLLRILDEVYLLKDKSSSEIVKMNPGQMKDTDITDSDINLMEHKISEITKLEINDPILYIHFNNHDILELSGRIASVCELRAQNLIDLFTNVKDKNQSLLDVVAQEVKNPSHNFRVMRTLKMIKHGASLSDKQVNIIKSIIFKQNHNNSVIDYIQKLVTAIVEFFTYLVSVIVKFFISLVNFIVSPITKLFASKDEPVNKQQPKAKQSSTSRDEIKSVAVKVSADDHNKGIKMSSNVAKPRSFLQQLQESKPRGDIPKGCAHKARRRH